MSGMPVPGSQSPLDAVWSALQLATERYNFYENIVQIRLQSFVLADSVLILGWVTLYASASQGQSYRDVALVALALLSIVFSVTWTSLGFRQNNFLLLQMDIVLHLESMIPDGLRITEPVYLMQQGDPYKLKHVERANRTLQLRQATLHSASRHLAIFTPIAFGVASVLLLVISSLGLS